MRKLGRVLSRPFDRLRRWYENAQYDDISVVEKFRRQGAVIGEGCFIQIRHLAAEPYLVEIGNNVSIGSDVRLITHDGASVVFREEYPSLRYFGRIVIEDNCFLGEGVVVTAGVRIGRESIVGARAVVLSDVKPGSVVVGNPAMRISTTEKYREKCLRLWKEQRLDTFEHLFAGKSKYEVQRMFISKQFQEMLRRHFTGDGTLR